MHSRKRRDTSLAGLVPTRSRAMRALVETAGKLVDRDTSILILGESGSGKNHLAAAIHAAGPRAAQPFVTIDCASIPHDLFESELFGYEKGTFTDATERRIGRLESAGAGTAYFDDIAALTPALQPKLLRAMEERRFTRLGGGANVAFNARVISSANVNLDALAAAGTFRRDLLYRINVVTLTVPPLRERREDIEPLAKFFLGKHKRGFDAEAMELLVAYSWPGNVRELRNVVERAALIEETDLITASSLPIESIRDPEAFMNAATRDAWTLEDLERRYIVEILRRTKQNNSRAARILGINRKTLLEKRRKYGLE